MILGFSIWRNFEYASTLSLFNLWEPRLLIYRGNVFIIEELKRWEL